MLKQIRPIYLYISEYTRNKNGYKDVDLVADQFRANLQKSDGKSIWLGTFPYAEIAAFAHNCMALKIFGNKAILNKVEQPKNYTWNNEKDKLE